MANETLRYALTESGATTFTEFEKSLDTREIGKRSRSKNGRYTGKVKVMWIESIEISVPLLIADGDGALLQITTNSETAMVEISDKDCFFKADILMAGALAAGAYQEVQPLKFEVNKPYIIDKMYIAIEGVAVGALTVHMCINYSYKYISEAVVKRIIQRKI